MANHRNTLILALAALCLLVVLLFVLRSSEQQRSPARTHTSTLNTQSANWIKAQTAVANSSDANCDAGVSIPPGELRHSHYDEDKLGALMGNAKDHPKALEASANAGDANSAIALFRVLTSCYPPSATLLALTAQTAVDIKPVLSHCAVLSNDTIKARVDVLLPAASAGSAEAALLYATNAEPLVEFYRQQGSRSAVTAADRLQKNAQDLLRKAQNQLVEAHQLSAERLQYGILEKKDLVAAYTHYLIAANASGQPPNSPAWIALQQQLPAEKRDAVATRLTRCSGSSSALINPFK